MLRMFLPLLLAAPLAAALNPIGGSLVQVFDAKVKDFRQQPVQVLYQPQPEVLQVQLPGFRPGTPLNARLHLERLPHYQTWVKRRQAEGGLAWTTLSALLGELQGRPASFLTLGPVPGQGPLEIRVGLLNERRFELYARVRGTVISSQRGLVFEVQELFPERASAKAAWAVLAPLARSQAGRMAGQRQGAGL